MPKTNSGHKKSKRRLIGGAVFLILLLLSGLYIWSVWRSRSESVKKQVIISGWSTTAEVVTSAKEREKGLSGRGKLCDDCSMLFEFPTPERYPFWMKKMEFDLDIIWMMDGKVVDVRKNVSKDFYGTLIPSVQADKALEVNAGTADKHGIDVGSIVQIF